MRAAAATSGQSRWRRRSGTATGPTSASFAAAELDLTKLKPLIDAIRRRGGTTGEGGPEPTAGQIYQVREPTPVYQV